MTALDNLTLRLDQYAAATRLRTAARRDAVAALDEAADELTPGERVEIESLLGVATI